MLLQYYGDFILFICVFVSFDFLVLLHFLTFLRISLIMDDGNSRPCRLNSMPRPPLERCVTCLHGLNFLVWNQLHSSAPGI